MDENQFTIDDLLEKALEQSPWQDDETDSWAKKDGSLQEIYTADEESLFHPPKSYFTLRKHFINPLFENENNWGVLIVRGPRRIGKTSTLKYTIREMIKEGYPKESFFYFSLDDEVLLGALERKKMLKEFMTALINKYSLVKPLLIVLDEVTFYKGWGRAIKNLIDEGVVGKGIGVVLTGSYSLDLNSAKSELSGRCGPLGEFFSGEELFFPRRFTEMADTVLDEEFRTFMYNNLLSVGKRLGLLEYLAGYQTEGDSARFGYRRKIDAFINNHYDNLHALFENYKYSGGYPRAIYEALHSQYIGTLNIRDARYKQDIYDLLVTDCRKFGLQGEVLSSMFLKVDTPIKRMSADYDLLKVASIRKEDILKYKDYLEVSGLFMFLPNVSSPNQIDASSQLVSPSRNKLKFVVADPAVYSSIYGCSRGMTHVYQKMEQIIEGGVEGFLFEAIVLAHLRFLPAYVPFENISYILHEEDGKEYELADALIWYVNNLNNFIHIAIEVKCSSSINKGEIYGQAKKLRENYGIKRLIVVSDSKDIDINEYYVIIPIELFLLLF